MKKTHIEEAVQVALNDIQTLEMRIEALNWAVQPLRSQSHYRGEQAPEVSHIYSGLMDLLHEANRRLFMFAAVAPEKAQKAARKEALRRYLTERHGILEYKVSVSDPAPSFFGDDEKEFRTEILKEMEDNETPKE